MSTIQNPLPSIALHALRIHIVACLLILAGGSRASTWTVSNSANHPAQHTSIQNAINTAAAGDTILVTGSATNYGNFNVTKPLMLIGAGHNTGAQATQIGSPYFFAGSNNSVLIGFSTSTIFLNNNTNMSGIRIERCRSSAIQMNNFTFTISDLIIRNCVVGAMTLSVGCNNIDLTNNMFTGSINASNATNMVMSHNLFVNTTTGFAFQNLTAAVITNNIFWGRTPVDSSVNNCSFNNNITYQTTNNTIPYGTNVGVNNLVGVNPLFVNAPDRSGSLAYDYNLQAGSPGKNTASDGTDIGIFGGGFAFIDLTGRARIPLVTTMTLLSSSVPQGGTLDVQIAGTKVD